MADVASIEREAVAAVQPERLTGFSGPDAPPWDVINRCVHCGFCLPACPTYRITLRERSSPRGRITLIKGVAEGRLDVLDPTFQEEMYLCLNCRACEAACPSGVKYGELVESARAQIEEQTPRPAQVRLARTAAFRGLFGGSRRFRLASSGLASCTSVVVRRTRCAAAASCSGSDLPKQEAMLPSLSDRFLTPGREFWPAQGARRGTVALLAGCIMSTAYADVHRATARVLARNGFDVIVPDGQGCCGALAIHSGDLTSGRAAARANIDAFGSSDDRRGRCQLGRMWRGDARVRLSAAQRLRPGRSARGGSLRGVRDASEFLADAGLTAPPGAA